MKINGVLKELKFKILKNLKSGNSKIYLGISLELLYAVWGSVVSDSSLFQLILLILLLEVYRPLPK